MKKLLLAVSLFVTVSVSAQTTEIDPGLAKSWLGTAFSWLANSPDAEVSTNWSFVAYASHAKGLVDGDGHKAEWGGGLAALYPLNAYVRTGVRMQYIDGNIFLPSVNVQLQTIKTYGKFSLTPSVYTGLLTPWGNSNDTGTIGTLTGISLSAKYKFTDSFSFGIGGAVEKWSNLPVDYVNHFGVIATVSF